MTAQPFGIRTSSEPDGSLLAESVSNSQFDDAVSIASHRPTVGRPSGGPGRRNSLLQRVQRESPEEYARLDALLETITLRRDDVLIEAGGAIPFVYFPEGSVGSLIRILSTGKRIEVGTAGLEGMVGIPAFLNAETTPVQCVVQVPGAARRLAARTLHEVAGPGTVLRSLLQRYAQYLFNQAAQSVACNWMHGIELRCARWLLMTHDRVVGDELALTHEYLATMLGARRAGVSEAAESLRSAGLIDYRRGKLTIVDRAGLERATCECYASDRADYARLFPDSALAPTQNSLAHSA